MKLKFVALACATAVGFSAAPAKAETVDIATLKCADVKNMDADAGAVMITWIDGYMGGRAEDTRFDTDRMGQNIDAAIKACGEDDQQSLMSVIKDAESAD